MPTPPLYRVKVSPAARRQVAKLPTSVRQRIETALDNLNVDPRPAGARALVGSDALRLRVGDYRAVYRVDDTAKAIEVLRVAHRREVYRR